MTSEITSARLAELAAQRVAAGTASTIESAIWSITHSTDYRDGRCDALASRPARCPRDGTEGYIAGYARGYQWSIHHPAPTR